MKKYLPYIVFATITILIMFPLYRDGFVFLLDMVFVPDINLADYLHNGLQASFPLILIIKILSYVLPLSVIQKIILSLLLFLPGVCMYRLCQHIYRFQQGEGSCLSGPTDKSFSSLRAATFSKWALLAGLFYMLNPWVYERFLAGHWLVLAGYAFLPLLIKLFWQLLTQANKKNFIKFAVLFAVYPIINLHWFYISTLFLIVLFVVYLVVQYRSKKLEIRNKKLISNFQFLISRFLILIAIFVLINSFWLFSFFSPSSTFEKISFNDFMAFQTQTDAVWGPYFNVLSLYGFWNPDYFLPKDTLNYWWMLTFIILILFIIGLSQVFKKKNILGIILGVLFIPIVLIAVGYTHWLTQPIVKFLCYSLSGFKGLRETGKLIGLLAFSYALIVPIGAKCLAGIFKDESLPRVYRKRLNAGVVVYIVALLIPILTVHNIFLAFNHQVKAADYPSSWYQANQILTADDKALFLPWHGYPRLSFANFKRVSNPASRFFKADIVTGKSIENIYLLETDQGIWDDKMFKLLHGFEAIDENLEFFKSQNISYIILAKEADYNRYGFLDNSKQLKKALDTKDLTLYRLEYN